MNIAFKNLTCNMKAQWLAKIKAAEKTCFIQDGWKKVHYKFGDGEEMAEEYNAETGVLVKRCWRVGGGTTLRGAGWVTEVGDPQPNPTQPLDIGMSEATGSPYIIKRLTKNVIEWRIRNLTYPVENYKVIIDAENMAMIVKTENKKYYKKIELVDLERADAIPHQKHVDFTHKFNTLIITYKKPPEMVQLEKEVMEEIDKAKVLKDVDSGSGCATS